MRTQHLLSAASALLIGLAAAAVPAQAQYFEGVYSGFPAPTGDTAFIPAGSKLMRLFDGGRRLRAGRFCLPRRPVRWISLVAARKEDTP